MKRKASKIETPYKATFTAVAKAVSLKEKDMALSLATLENLKPLLPKDLDLESNIDVVPFACDLTVINRANLNNHLTDTETGLILAPNFKYKFANLEHDRNQIVGVVANYGFSSFGSSSIITEEKARETKEPFNMSVSGYVWRAVNEEFAELLEESSDPSSDKYESISVSWEVGFFKYYLISGSRNISEAVVIKDEEEIKELSQYLSQEGGSGVLPNGDPIYQVIAGTGEEEPIALGLGFTTNPAAKVKGVLTANIKNDEKIISQNQKNNVIKISMKNPRTLSEVTDEMLAQASFSKADLELIVRNEIEQANKQFKQQLDTAKTEKQDFESKLAAAQQEVESLKSDKESLLTEKENLAKENEQLKEEKAAKEKSDRLAERMTALDEAYELDAEKRKFISAQIEGLEDEAYDSWKNDFTKFLTEKDNNSNIDPSDALASATAGQPNVPVTSVASEDKFKKIGENFKVTIK